MPRAPVDLRQVPPLQDGTTTPLPDIGSTSVETDLTALRNFRQQHLPHQAVRDLLSTLQQRLANLPPSQVDHHLAEALQQLADLLAADFTALAHLDKTGKFLLSHRHHAPPFASTVAPIPALNLDNAFPWAATSLRKGQTIVLRHPADLPPEAVNERTWSAAHNLHACLAIPLFVRGIPLSALIIASTNSQPWPDTLLANLLFAGNILALTLARKYLEEDLQRTRESLAHMLRVAMTGQLATSIAHEINQPLSAMIANAQAAIRFISRPQPDFAETTEALTEVVRDGKRAAEVITRAHTLLKRNDVEYTPQNIIALVAAIRPLVDNYATLRQVRVRFDFDSALPPVRGHGVQIQQVALNLLINAIDAIPPELAGKGAVSLTITPAHTPAQVLVFVKDNGVGLPPGPIEQIFRPFFTTKSSGLGMGLNISRNIIEAHGGQLTAERNSDVGATFRFTIPTD